MRWRIKSTETNIDQKTGKRTITETKELKLTIGDAVGVGKNAKNAIEAASRTLPALASTVNDPNLNYLSSSVGILGAVVKGLDIYKGLTRTIEAITPIVQIAARGSGVWCSPGNIGDIAQIVIGQVQKILISLAISGILKLKEIIWNYEFTLKEIRSDYVDYINVNMDNLNKKLADIRFKSFDEPINVDIGIKGNVDCSNAIDWDNEIDFKDCSDVYVTKYEVNGNNRLLRGNLRDLGIQYSDDNGETWQTTNQKDGSWGCFAKIPAGDGYTYVAGGVDYIKEIEPATEPFDIDNKNYFYYDKGIDKIVEYTYSEKRELDISDANIEKEYKKSLGIYYSTDNGITWEKSNNTDWINDFGEFEEKKGKEIGTTIPYTVTAASNNFNGCWYSEDGIDWKASSENTGRWVNVKDCSTGFKIIQMYSSEFVNEIDKIKLIKGTNIKIADIYEGFFANIPTANIISGGRQIDIKSIESKGEINKLGVTKK